MIEVFYDGTIVVDCQYGGWWAWLASDHSICDKGCNIPTARDRLVVRARTFGIEIADPEGTTVVNAN